MRIFKTTVEMNPVFNLRCYEYRSFTGSEVVVIDQEDDCTVTYNGKEYGLENIGNHRYAFVYKINGRTFSIEFDHNISLLKITVYVGSIMIA